MGFFSGLFRRSQKSENEYNDEYVEYLLEELEKARSEKDRTIEAQEELKKELETERAAKDEAIDSATPEFTTNTSWEELSGYDTSSDSSTSQTAEKLNWIERLINKISTAYNRLKNVVLNTAETWLTRNNALSDSMQVLLSEIDAQNKVYDYYMNLFNSYGLDEYYKNGYIADYNKYYDMLKKAENRLLGTGFYEHDVTINEQLYDLNLSVPTKNFIGIVLEYDRENKRCHIEQRNYFKVGDLVEVFTPTKSFTLRILDLYTEDGEAIEVARHPKQKLYFTSDIVLEPYDMLRSYEES